MMKSLFIGVWACMVTLLSSYVSAYWAAGAPTAKPEQPYLEGLEYRKLQPINVPMILDGVVRGYVTAKLVYTADANTLRRLSVAPEVFVTNEAFNEIYTHGRVEFGKLSKYNLKEMMQNIKKQTNAKIGNVVEDVLVDGINYVDKSEMRTASGRSGNSAAGNASDNADRMTAN